MRDISGFCGCDAYKKCMAICTLYAPIKLNNIINTSSINKTPFLCSKTNLLNRFLNKNFFNMIQKFCSYQVSSGVWCLYKLHILPRNLVRFIIKLSKFAYAHIKGSILNFFLNFLECNLIFLLAI
jgi:hypothetical protein